MGRRGKGSYGVTLAGVKAKIERAKKHVADIEAEIRAFLCRKPYQVFTEDNTKRGKRWYKVRVLESPPLRWNAIVGDAVHNLRVALDHLAWQLVIANKKTPSRTTCFPICDSEEEFETRGVRIIQLMNPTAIDMIRKLKPYQGGEKALYRLRCLDDFDKHRLLLVVGAVNVSSVVVVPIRFDEQNVSSPIPSLQFYGSVFPLEDEATLLVVETGESRGEEMPFEKNYQFTFDVAFGDGEVVKGQPILPTLQHLVNFTERIVQIFERYILGSPR